MCACLLAQLFHITISAPHSRPEWVYLDPSPNLLETEK